MIFQQGVTNSVTIKTVDNGWIVEWEDNRPEPDAFERHRDKKPNRGARIFTKKAEMIKFVEAHS